MAGEKATLVAANVGDSKVVLCRAGTAVQLSVDHKVTATCLRHESQGGTLTLLFCPFWPQPDVESERKRIEAKNPTPRLPLVRKYGSTPHPKSAYTSYADFLHTPVKETAMCASFLSSRGQANADDPFPFVWRCGLQVQNIDGIWRVGGLLALSRAFGDVYLKE